MGKLLVLGTGGTIACEMTAGGLAPQISAEQLVKIAGLDINICTADLFSLDSTDMTPRHWEQTASYIHGHYDEFDGFVILHGTDTMAYAAASAACLIQNSGKPIVFTGSMQPLDEPFTDADENLRDALRFAANGGRYGVYIVFGGFVFEPWDAVKTWSKNENAFTSANCKNVSVDTALAYPFPENMRATCFYERLSDDVFLAKLAPGQALCVPENTRALILESYGTGGIPDYLMESVRSLANRGVYIIIGTQCLHDGTALERYAVGRADFPIIETRRFTTEYALARARWALSYSDNYDDFKKMFYGDAPL